MRKVTKRCHFFSLPGHFYFTPKLCFFLRPGPFCPRICMAESWPNRWKNFGRIGGSIGQEVIHGSLYAAEPFGPHQLWHFSSKRHFLWLRGTPSMAFLLPLQIKLLADFKSSEGGGGGRKERCQHPLQDLKPFAQNRVCGKLASKLLDSLAKSPAPSAPI